MSETFVEVRARKVREEYRASILAEGRAEASHKMHRSILDVLAKKFTADEIASIDEPLRSLDISASVQLLVQLNGQNDIEELQKLILDLR